MYAAMNHFRVHPERAFLDWTNSEAFRAAHAQARMPQGVVLGPPRFAGWASVDLTPAG